MKIFAKIWILLFVSLIITCYGQAQTTKEGSFMHNGLLRTYRLYIPAKYNPAVKVPLIINLHGHGSNNIEQEAYGDFRPIADTAGFIIVHPNGTLDFINKMSWNTFGFSTVDDVGFISALIDTISAKYTIDKKKVYGTGMSNGGFMSYKLACQLSSRIAAVASVTGSMTIDNLLNCAAIRPVPVMEIHGTADETVPFIGNGFFSDIPTIVDYWVKNNHCASVPVLTQVPDVNKTDGCTAERYVYKNGDLGSTVELYKIMGGGHTWPGALYTIGVTNMDFSASTEIWRFFRKYDLNGLLTTGTKDDIASSSTFNVYPNPSRAQFNIDFPDTSPKSIIVANYLGQTIQYFNSDGKTATFTIQEKGIYWVTVKQGNVTRTQKVIKL